MTRYLCISVTFLDPLFHGKGDDDASEWPPSPMRLFQALLSGARKGFLDQQWNDELADAFRWLEGSEPPLIVGPPARTATRCTYFVPNNDSDKKFHRQERLTEKVSAPHRLNKGDTVHYVWSLGRTDEANESHAEQLCHAARHLLSLGWGIDQTVGHGRILNEAEVVGIPGQRWRSWRTHRPAARAWRVPTEGSLRDLEESHQSFLQRIEGKQYQPPRRPCVFDTVEYMHTTSLPPRPFAVFEFSQGVGFSQVRAVQVAAMLRSLACRLAKKDTHTFPGGSETYVAGHTGKQRQSPPRFSYLPLPTIGHEHADGMIRRVIIAEPFGGDGTHVLWAQNRLRNETLRDHDGDECGILLELWRPSSKRVIQRYLGEARTWYTVTPVVLPGFDDGRLAKAEKLFLSAVAHAGLPLDALEELAMRKAPFLPSSHHPTKYATPDYLGGLPKWHVRFRLREPMLGPLAIGAGRHAGLGLFVPAEPAR
jgi:CRISPR-associated protein Csb2